MNTHGSVVSKRIVLFVSGTSRQIVGETLGALDVGAAVGNAVGLSVGETVGLSIRAKKL